MPKTFLAVLCCLLVVGGVSAQWLEKTWVLPDSLSGVKRPTVVLYNCGNNTVFVAGDLSWLVVLDGVTGRKIARIPDFGAPLCHNPAENKMYAASGGSVAVIDAAANRVVKVLPGYVHEFCYNATMNRVYAASDVEVLVIDCRRDSLLSTVALPSWSGDICCSPVSNRVYCMMENEDVAVIDCATDSVIKTFFCGYGPYYDMLYNPLNNRVYVSERGDEDVMVIDCAGDSIVAGLWAGYGPDTMCLNLSQNKLYVADASGELLTVIDCAADTVAGLLDAGSGQAGLTWDSIDNLVYVSRRYEDSVMVVDCSADTVVRRLELAGRPSGLCYNPTNNLVYAACRNLSYVAGLLGSTGEVVLRQLLWYGPSLTAVRALGDKLYCADPAWDLLLVVDCNTGRQRSLIPVSRATDLLFYNRATDRLYCADSLLGDSTVYVVHCAGDSSVALDGVGPRIGGFCYGSAGNRVYCANSDSGARTVTVLDGTSDSILKRIDVRARPRLLEYNSAANRVYASLDDSETVVVIDAGADTVEHWLHPSGIPQQLLYLPERNVLCCASAGCVELYDGTTHERLGTIPLESEPGDMACSPTSNKLFVANRWNRSVTVADLDSMRPTGRVVVGAEPVALDYDSAANKVYCLNAQDRTVASIDCQTDSVVASVVLEPGATRTTWDPARRRLYVSHPSYSMVSVVTDTATVGLAAYPVGMLKPFRPTILRGSLLLPSAPLSARYSLLTPDGRNVLDLVPGENDIRHLAPGVYFVCEEGSVDQGVKGPSRKVVVTR